MKSILLLNIFHHSFNKKDGSHVNIQEETDQLSIVSLREVIESKIIMGDLLFDGFIITLFIW